MNRSHDTIHYKTRADRLAELWAIMEGCLGKPIPEVDRHEDVCNARALIYYRMLQEGFSNNGTAKVANKNAATLLHATRNAAFYVTHPRMYPDEANLWHKFNQAIQDHDDAAVHA